jgi:Tol biopolymer transport system component
MTLGTVSYMSPEQALAQPVDARTDLWSLGVVLYEMIAGQLPFRGDSQIAVANAIANTPAPPLTTVRSGVPMELERVVGRALAKSADDRYQTAADLLSELRRLKRESDGHGTSASVAALSRTALAPSPAAPGPTWTRGRLWLVATGLVVIVGAVAYVVLPHGETTAALPQLTNPVQIAASIGVEHYPSWSPDNRMIAYQSDQSGNNDIWVTQPGGGPPINRTPDYDGDDMYPRWSPDGLQIAFYSAREGGGIFVMSALAGGAHKIAPPLSAAPAPAAWSPDGSEIAYAIAEGNTTFLERRLADGTTKRAVLPGRKGTARIDLAWSPDGKFIAYVDTRNYSSQVTQLWMLRLADGHANPISDGRTNDWSPTWTPDSRAVYFTSNRGGPMDLWRQQVAADGSADGAAERLTTGLEVAAVAVSRDGKRLAYVKGRRLANAWRTPILKDRPATWADAQQLTSDQAHIEFIDVSRDGQRLAVSSDRSGNPDIWTLPAGGGEMQRITTDPTPDWDPNWSPNGSELVFYAYRSGNREIWAQPVAGGPARQLTHGETESVLPRWSPDGKSIVYVSRLGEFSDIWTVPAAGGEPRQIVGDPSAKTYPDWSRLEWLALRSNSSGPNMIWRVPAAGGTPEVVSRGPGDRPLWSPDGTSIYFTRLENNIRNVWSVVVDGRIERPLTALTGRRGIMEFSFGSDGKYLYFPWREDVGDIWTMDVVVKR